jgi:hypothetical protein
VAAGRQPSGHLSSSGTRAWTARRTTGSHRAGRGASQTGRFLEPQRASGTVSSLQLVQEPRVLRFCSLRSRSPRGEAEARQRPQEDGPATIEGEEGTRRQTGRPRRVRQGRQQREAVAAVAVSRSLFELVLRSWRAPQGSRVALPLVSQWRVSCSSKGGGTRGDACNRGAASAREQHFLETDWSAA